MHDLLDKEPFIEQVPAAIKATKNRAGDCCRHNLKTLRGFEIRRFANKPNREAFVFSTLSPVVLQQLGAANVAIDRCGFDGVQGVSKENS